MAFYESSARVFKALADPKRLQILALLKNGEKCTCVLTGEMGLPQSSLSYHMKILCEAGLVTGREDGKWTHYRLQPAGGQRALALLQDILTEGTGCENTGCEATGNETTGCKTGGCCR